MGDWIEVQRGFRLNLAFAVGASLREGAKVLVRMADGHAILLEGDAARTAWERCGGEPIPNDSVGHPFSGQAGAKTKDEEIERWLREGDV